MRLAALALLVLSLTVAAGAASRAAGSSTTRPCTSAVDTGVLPQWARGGFSEPRPRIAHVLGRSGRIVAILFARPLHSPSIPGRNNKILWVAREATGTALRIVARRMKGVRPIGTAVTRRVAGGPGPSIIDMPTAGCWRFKLAWSGRTDSLDLVYARPGS